MELVFFEAVELEITKLGLVRMHGHLSVLLGEAGKWVGTVYALEADHVVVVLV